MTLVATINVIIFSFLFCSLSSTFLIEGVLGSKNLCKKCDGSAKKLRVDPFPENVGYFGAPWRPFWNFEVFIVGMTESKNLFCESRLEGPNNKVEIPFRHCRPFYIKQAVRCFRRYGVAGSDRVTPAPLGWYVLI